ncbi:hypothetical protein P3L10_027647 [Capsicum annuum]
MFSSLLIVLYCIIFQFPKLLEVVGLDYTLWFSAHYLLFKIWQHIEKLDAEVLTEDTPPLVRKAMYRGLQRRLDERLFITLSVSFHFACS